VESAMQSLQSHCAREGETSDERGEAVEQCTTLTCSLWRGKQTKVRDRNDRADLPAAIGENDSATLDGDLIEHGAAMLA